MCTVYTLISTYLSSNLGKYPERLSDLLFFAKRSCIVTVNLRHWKNSSSDRHKLGLKYLNSIFGKYPGRISDLLEKYITPKYFFNQKNDSYDLNKLDFKIFKFQLWVFQDIYQKWNSNILKTNSCMSLLLFFQFHTLKITLSF